jgi:hypothetical protein
MLDKVKDAGPSVPAVSLPHGADAAEPRLPWPGARDVRAGAKGQFGLKTGT